MFTNKQQKSCQSPCMSKDICQQETKIWKVKQDKAKQKTKKNQKNKTRRNGCDHTILDYYILYRIKKPSAGSTVRDTSRLELLLLALLSYKHVSLTVAQILKPSGNHRSHRSQKADRYSRTARFAPSLPASQTGNPRLIHKTGQHVGDLV